jgi:ABC-type nickel/cobalt efflux system permease component RcnA
MPPSGDYSLRIAPAAARATANKTNMQNVSTILAISVAMWQYYTARIARYRRFKAFIKATKHRHWASTHSDKHQSDMSTPISGVHFIVKSLKKSSSCPNNNRDVTYETDEKHLNNMSKYFVGVVNIVFNCCNNHFL